MRCTGFSRYEPSGSRWRSIFCVDVSSAFVCDACSRAVSSDVASG